MLDLKGDSAVWSQQVHGRSENMCSLPRQAALIIWWSKEESCSFSKLNCRELQNYYRGVSSFVSDAMMCRRHCSMYQDQRITESWGLENTSKIIKPSHYPSTAKSTITSKPCPISSCLSCFHDLPEKLVPMFDHHFTEKNFPDIQSLSILIILDFQYPYVIGHLFLQLQGCRMGSCSSLLADEHN